MCIRDRSATEPGWEFRIARQEYIAGTPAIPGVPEVPGYYTPQPDLITPQPDLIVPQPDLVTVIPATPAQVINRNNSNSGIVTNLTSAYDYAASPPNQVLGNSYETMADDGGLSADYTTSHSRCIIYDAGAGNKIMINPVSFHTEPVSYTHLTLPTILLV